MVQKLSERLEEQVRQYITDNIRPTEIEGYDPQQTDPTASDFLPTTCDWSQYGDTYPVIVVQETDGPVIPNSGNTNSNGIQGDGSGVNQYAVHPVTISVQAVQGDSYRNSTDYDDLVQSIYAEVKFQFKDVDAVSDGIFTGTLTPPTATRSTDETDSGSTETWYQHQGTLPVGILYEP